MLVAGRVIAGIAVGIASSVVPIYQSEITPPAIRGRLVSMQQWYVRCSHHSQLDSTRACQVDHLGYSPPVLCRVRLLVHQWQRFLPYSLGRSDDSRHRSLHRYALLSRVASLAYGPRSVSPPSTSSTRSVNNASIARRRRSKSSRTCTAAATSSTLLCSSSTPRLRSRSVTSARREPSRTRTSSSPASAAASSSVCPSRCGRS